VVLIGREYWRSLGDLLNGMVAAGTIDASDLSLLLVTDDLDEAMAHLERHAIQSFGLQKRRVPTPSRWLGERSPRPAPTSS
jgi:predicted Rossmann-fold nucleotide-binding protein